MGMFDSFYFADGILDDNKVEAGFEFQTKALDDCLDKYYVLSDGRIKKTIMSDDVGGYIDDPEPYSIDGIIDVYSYDFSGENTKHQRYRLKIVNNRIIGSQKIAEEGYE